MTTADTSMQPMLVRAFFGDETAWDAVLTDLADVEDPVTGRPLVESVKLVEDPLLDKSSWDQIVNYVADQSGLTYAFVVDEETSSGAERLVAVVDLRANSPLEQRMFRVQPANLAEVHANLYLANVEFGDFWSASGPDRVYRAPAAEPDPVFVSVERVLSRINRSPVPAATLSRLVDALSEGSSPQVAAKWVHNTTSSAQFYRDNSSNYEYCEEVVGWDETLEFAERGGSALVFSIASQAARWTVYLDPASEVVLAALLTRMPGSPWAQATPS
ncbi:DUF6924 domain-containing protein [Rhodococcoides kroppenstedtii]|uniref:DUF6924 domain-containing protein n=1 Tax=Rhodococcoides kroppenstedtii TaxID=293050 RepID=UPI003637E342